ncbi:CPCC family cysteine-rich protein [Halomicrobium urmianum]|uniref:CPCC family cysteine-rich protein n=1 Tax=Halomicrobium urmianum TaxID=1586233 RepID=UPI001CD956BD|nr:CPCC family cysteine-rich protein [Halomicrobium urmianum]
MAADAPGNPASRELGFCPCCGYRTLPRCPPGSYAVCPVCQWLDDPVQFGDPEYVSDTNHVSLVQARANFREHGACVPDAVEEAGPPGDAERDPNWPYDE